MSDIYAIAASAMAASAARLDTIAYNMANARDEPAILSAGSSKSAVGGPLRQPVTVNMSANASGVSADMALASYRANAAVFAAAKQMSITLFDMAA